MLLDNGADMHKKNTLGFSPLSYSLRCVNQTPAIKRRSRSPPPTIPSKTISDKSSLSSIKNLIDKL
jgi:hypothetical protein